MKMKDEKRTDENMKKEKKNTTTSLACACGAVFSDDQLFCTNCGASKEEAQKVKYKEIYEKTKTASSLKEFEALRASCDAISGYRNIEDWKQFFDKKIESLTKKKKKKTGRIVGISCGAAVLVALAVLFVIFVMPYLPHFLKAQKAVKSEDYVLAIEEYKQAEGFLGSDEKLPETYYAYGAALQNEEKYLDAANAFHDAGSHADAEARISACGKALIEKKQYADASKVFSLLSTKESKAYVNYANGMEQVEKENYDKALEYFEKAGDVEDAAKRIGQAHYVLGKKAISTDTESARKHLQAAGDYKDAKDLLKVCDLMDAEQEAQAGNLNKALSMFKKLPANLSYQKINAGERVKLLESNQAFLNVCGKWRASKNYIESRNVYTRTGSWDSWYLDEVETEQTITVRCILNKNGTFTLKGTVSYYYFNNYSSLSSQCKARLTTESFEAKNLKTLPATVRIDDSTTLSLTNGIFSVKYSYRDDYSMYFYNVYSSSVTYGTKLEKY